MRTPLGKAVPQANEEQEQRYRSQAQPGAQGELAGGLEALLRGCISPGEQRGHTDLDLNSDSNVCSV